MRPPVSGASPVSGTSAAPVPAPGGRPRRVVLHAHSDWSYDGRWTLARIARLYGAIGVDAVMMTEHDSGFEPERFAEYRAACAAASTPRCRLIPGIEYSSPDNDIHILTWGLTAFLAEHRPVAETLERVAAAGGAAVFAHPVRRDAWRQFDDAWIPHLSGIELWNRKSDGITAGPRAAALIARTGLAPTVGNDFHRLRNLYPLTMQGPLTIAGDAVTGGEGADPEAALCAALKAGALTPMAFGRPLVDGTGTVDTAWHDRLDGLRRRLLRARSRR